MAPRQSLRKYLASYLMAEANVEAALLSPSPVPQFPFLELVRDIAGAVAWQNLQADGSLFSNSVLRECRGWCPQAC